MAPQCFGHDYRCPVVVIEIAGLTARSGEFGGILFPTPGTPLVTKSFDTSSLRVVRGIGVIVRHIFFH